MEKTKLNVNDPNHRTLLNVMSSFVDDYGYSPRELYDLLEDSKWLFLSQKELKKDKKGLVN